MHVKIYHEAVDYEKHDLEGDLPTPLRNLGSVFPRPLPPTNAMLKLMTMEARHTKTNLEVKTRII